MHNCNVVGEGVVKLAAHGCMVSNADLKPDPAVNPCQHHAQHCLASHASCQSCWLYKSMALIIVITKVVTKTKIFIFNLNYRDRNAASRAPDAP